MRTEDQVVLIAKEVHRRLWTNGSDVSGQTKKSQSICGVWQEVVLEQLGKRFEAEVPLNERGPAQRIDLVDWRVRTGYELKASPNNVHMDIYRDVFKALVFNERNPERALKKLIFIAPFEGIARLGTTFPEDVQKIAARLDLTLGLRSI